MDLTSHNWERARRVLVWWGSGTASSPRVAIGIAVTPPGLDHRTWWGVDLHLAVQLPDLELRQCRGRHGQLVPQQLAADRERRAVARAVQPPGRRLQGQPATQMRADPRYRPQRTTGASYKPDDRAAASEATAVSACSLTTPVRPITPPPPPRPARTLPTNK